LEELVVMLNKHPYAIIKRLQEFKDLTGGTRQTILENEGRRRRTKLYLFASSLNRFKIKPAFPPR